MALSNPRIDDLARDNPPPEGTGDVVAALAAVGAATVVFALLVWAILVMVQ